jgi:hypothetical protein
VTPARDGIQPSSATGTLATESTSTDDSLLLDPLHGTTKRKSILTSLGEERKRKRTRWLPWETGCSNGESYILVEMPTRSSSEMIMKSTFHMELRV